MRLSVELMHNYALSVGMPEIEKDITVHVYYNFDNLVDAYYDTFKPVGVSKDWIRQNTWRGIKGLGGKGSVFIDASKMDGLNRHFQVSLGAHEFNHAQVYDLSELNLGGSGKTPAGGPHWLVEGTADFFAWQALSEGGIIPYEELREGRLKYAKRIPDSLEAMETRQGIDSIYNSYDYAMLAVELLASRSGQGSLFRYYASLKPGTTWQDAFDSAFGMTVDQFYDLFEEHRAAGFPKLDIPKLSPTPTYTATPVVLYRINWVVGDFVPSEIEENLRYGAQLAHDYAVSMGMPELEKDITVYAYNDLERLSDAYYDVSGKFRGNSKNDIRRAIRNSQGFSSDGYVFFNTSKTSHKERQIRTAAHEFSHAHHAILSSLSLSGSYYTIPDGGPWWLDEGIAVFVSRRIVPEDERVSYEMAREEFLQFNLSNIGPLETIEIPAVFNRSSRNYGYSMLAVELLASRSGESSLMEYYASLRPGTTWQEQFQKTFGLSIGEFYDLFEEHRAAGFPKLEIPKFVER